MDLQKPYVIGREKIDEILTLMASVAGLFLLNGYKRAGLDIEDLGTKKEQKGQEA